MKNRFPLFAHPLRAHGIGMRLVNECKSDAA